MVRRVDGNIRCYIFVLGYFIPSYVNPDCQSGIPLGRPTKHIIGFVIDPSTEFYLLRYRELLGFLPSSNRDLNNPGQAPFICYVS